MTAKRTIPTTYQAHLLAALVKYGRPAKRSGFSWYIDDATGFPRPLGDTRTVLSALQHGWLLAWERPQLKPRDRSYIITPAGREALKLAQPELACAWSDADRIRLKQRKGARISGVTYADIFEGPLEVESCADHPAELAIYRWVWVPEGDDHLTGIRCGEVERVRRCPLCIAAAEREDEALARSALRTGARL